MAFDSTSTLLATGGADATVKVWDVVREYCTNNLRQHCGVVRLQLLYNYFTPAVVKNIAVSISICLSVCPFGCLKIHVSKFHKIFCTCYLWLWLSRFVKTVRYVVYLRFCG